MKKWIVIGMMLGVLGAATVHAGLTNPTASGTQMGADTSSRVIDSGFADTTINNVPKAYDTTAGSLIIDSAVGSTGYCVLNYTQGDLAGNYSSAVSTSAPASTVIDFYVPAAASGSFTGQCQDFSYPSLAIFFQSDTGSAVSGGKLKAWTY